VEVSRCDSENLFRSNLSAVLIFPEDPDHPLFQIGLLKVTKS
jgi:hypothetical protein